jgi:hypothetical protein
MPRGQGLVQLDSGQARGEDRRGFESGRRNPLGVTRSAIKQALEQAGIEFLDGGGVKIR